MDFNFIVDSGLINGISELEKAGYFKITVDGVKVYSEKTDGALKVVGTPDKITVYHATKAQFFYGLSFAIQNYGKSFTVERTADKRLGIMRDCARNATLGFNGAKTLLQTMSLLGYNYLELYVEDLLEIKEYPHLGFARGRFTPAEVKEYDEYAKSFGIELVPAIQTLAHLPFAFAVDELLHIRDKDDILLVGDEKTYEFIEKMVEFCSNNFTTRNVNIGMDEAFNLFMGKYLDQHGYVENKLPLLLEHLRRVAEICKKHGLKPAMWSDMVFKAAFNIEGDVAYRNLEGKTFDKEVAKTFPQDLTLIFWDYYHINQDFYDDVFEKHFQITDKVKFAGGVWTWVGYAPANTATESIFDAAFKSGKKYGCKDYLMTAWGDDGGECSTFMALSSFTYISEKVNDGDLTELDERMNALFGNTYKEFKSIENVDRPFRIRKKKRASLSDVINTSKYALYNDPLIGKLDASVSMSMKSGYKTRAKQFKELAEKGGKFSYLFETAYRLCDVLSLKATLGLELDGAYKAGDKQTLEFIIKKTIPQTLKKVEKFCEAYRTQWLKENKTYGYESFGIRIGGVKERLKETARLVNDYLDGNIEKIDELEREKIPISCGFKKDVPVRYNNYRTTATGSIL